MHFLIVIGLVLLIIYIILDVWRVIKIKTVPPLPQLDGKTLSSDGLLRIYEYFRDPNLIPKGIKLTEEYIIGEIQDSVQYVNSRYDCADFWAQLLFRLYKENQSELPPKVKELIKNTLVGFKFWMDMPGDDSMCYFSENHTILFSELEYLVGQEWPDEIFSNSGLSGKDHMKRAKTRMLYWIDQRYKYGFFEWYSNNYFNEDLGALSQLIDYMEDNDLRQQCVDVFNLILFEVFTHNIENRFCVVSSRLYGDNKASNKFGNRIKPVLNALLYDDFDYDPLEHTRVVSIDAHMPVCVLGMLKKGKYQLPQVLKDIAFDKTPRIIKSSNGMDSNEYKAFGLIGQHEYQIISQFSNETFVNPGFSMNTYRYHKRNKNFTNAFSAPMQFVDLGIIRFTRALPILCRILNENFMPTGISLSRGNVYTYRTADYMLSTAVNCHVDYCGTQHHVALATLTDDLNVFTMYPTSENFSKTPGYWAGNRRMPMSVQDKSINMTIFKMGKRKRLGEFSNLQITHTLFPQEKFDEVILEEKRIFGRKANTFIAIISNRSFKFKEYSRESACALVQHVQSSLVDTLLNDDANEYVLKEPFDIIAEGSGYHTYVTELSDGSVESFPEFVKRIKENTFESHDNTLDYSSNGKIYALSYDGSFKIDGEAQSLDYKRFESDFCTAERMPDKIQINFKNNSLHLENKTPLKAGIDAWKKIKLDYPLSQKE